MAKKQESIVSILRKVRSADFVIVLLVLALVLFGTVMVFSASYYRSINTTGSPYGYLKKQVVFVITGFIILYVVSILDYHIWKKFAIPVMLLSLGLLVLVLVAGTTVAGGQRWIGVGPITIMPGEIAKIAVIIFAAYFFADDPDRIRSLKRGILPMVFLGGLVAGLIVLQPNLSTAMTVLGILVAVLFIAGLDVRYIYGLVIVGAAGIAGICLFGQSYQRKRITSFLDPFADPQGDGFQVVQSLLALGTGGLFGKGLGKSVQKNLYLPEPQNDFILAIIGEELGFVAIVLLMAFFMLLIWRCCRVAMDAPDRFGMLLSGGVAAMIGLQVIMNVAVVTSSMPPTGIALPFISYGGNSLWLTMGAVGLVLSVSRQIPDKQPEEKIKREHRSGRKQRRKRESLA